MKWRIEYSPDAEEHVRVLIVRQKTIVLNAVDKELCYQPLVETRNRKPMRPNPVAPWELRMRNLRVYYDVQVKPRRVVYVRAVDIKKGNQVYYGKKAIQL